MTISQKTPLAVNLTNFTQKKVKDNLQLLGQVYPCFVTKVEGAIVTVNFQVNTGSTVTLPPVTCPIAESTYVRLPVQVGDYGICIPASTRLGGITGLGTNPKNPSPISLPSNLGALVFVPIGNAEWSEVDPNAVNINAPNGVVLRDTGNNCTVTLTPSGVTVVIGSTNITVSGTEVAITANTIALNGVIQLNGPVTQGTSTHGTNASFIGPLTVTNDVTAEGKSLATHVHNVNNVQGGSSTITTTSPD